MGILWSCFGIYRHHYLRKGGRSMARDPNSPLLIKEPPAPPRLSGDMGRDEEAGGYGEYHGGYGDEYGGEHPGQEYAGPEYAGQEYAGRGYGEGPYNEVEGNDVMGATR